jgi:hypothetical protein
VILLAYLNTWIADTLISILDKEDFYFYVSSLIDLNSNINKAFNIFMQMTFSRINDA